MKKVTKQTYANVTIREKRKHEDHETEISQAGYRKRAKMVSNTSKHDKNTKAVLLAKIIDKEGAEFGQRIKDQSKVIQETNKLTPQQTSSLMTGTRKDVILCVETNQDCI